MELYYLMSITDRERAEDMAALYRDAGLNLVTTMLGRGTATPEHLALYGLSRTEKAVTGAVVGADVMKQTILLLEEMSEEDFAELVFVPAEEEDEPDWEGMI